MPSAEEFIEAVLLSVVFLVCFGITVANFNSIYPSNYTVEFEDSSDATQRFIDYQEQAQTQIQGSEVQFDAEQGITVKSSWGLAKDAIFITWDFLNGGWIENVINAWNIGEAGTALALGLRSLYVIALIFALLYILFKVFF